VEGVQKTLSTISKERMKMENILLQSALNYANMGFYVFPCREKYEGKYYHKKKKRYEEALEKQPRIAGGFRNSSNDKEQIKRWWAVRGWENSCIGIDCGKSGIFVIDIDMHSANGLDNFSKLNISDEKAWHVSTANKGLHLIYSDPNGIGKTSTKEKTGIDSRGAGGYVIAPPSFILSRDGSKKFYKAIEEWNGKPQEITLDNIKELGLLREKNKEPKDVKIIQEKEVIKATKALQRLPFSFLENYQDWVNVGLALRELGDDGYNLWEQWTSKYFAEKPESKRIDTLRYKWDGFFATNNSSRIGLGSLYFWAYGNKNK
jgi:hypothetical protein